MNNNNRKSPCKQQRMKNSHPIPVPNNNNRLRSNSSMGSSYTKNSNFQYRQHSHTTSPTAMSASCSPAVPLFYSNTYADPPECSSLPKPPESWYLTSNDEGPVVAIKVEEEARKEIPKAKIYQKYNNKGFYSPFSSSKRIPPAYISVKA